MGLVEVGVVITTSCASPGNYSRQVAVGPDKPPTHIHVREFAATGHDAGADAVKSQIGSFHTNVVQFDPEPSGARSFHVADDAGTSESGFHQVRPAGAERRPSSPQCLAPDLHGSGRRDSVRNRVRVNDVQLVKLRCARQGRIAGLNGSGTHVQRCHARKPRLTKSVSFSARPSDDPVSTLGSGDVGTAAQSDAVQSRASFKLHCKVRLDLV